MLLVGTLDTDTDQSSLASLSRSPALSVEDEELQTVGGSTTSLSTSSFVSVSEEIRPPVEAEPRVEPTTLPSKDTPQKRQDPSPSTLHFFMVRLLKLWKSLVFYLTLLYHMVLKGLHPLTQDTTSALAKEHSQKIPLTNSLLALGSEASRRHCPEMWACHERTQLALLVLVGGGIERYMWKELKEVVYSEENWSRALYHLRHTLWPGGKFMKGSGQKPTEEQRREMRRQAVAAIKKFLPSEFILIKSMACYVWGLYSCYHFINLVLQIFSQLLWARLITIMLATMFLIVCKTLKSQGTLYMCMQAGRSCMAMYSYSTPTQYLTDSTLHLCVHSLYVA